MTVKREISDFDPFPPVKKTKFNPSTESDARWTDEKLKHLWSLKQQGHTFKCIPLRLKMTFRELTAYFPGRTEKALNRAMQRRGQEVKEEFTGEKVTESGIKLTVGS